MWLSCGSQHDKGEKITKGNSLFSEYIHQNSLQMQTTYDDCEENGHHIKEVGLFLRREIE